MAIFRSAHLRKRTLSLSFCVVGLVGMAACETTYPIRVSGVQTGKGGASADLVMFTNSPVGGQDDFDTRMAATRDGSRRDVMLGDRYGAGHVPAGWWDDQTTPQIERPYWIHTSRNAESWSVPRRIDSRREYEPYWAR